MNKVLDQAYAEKDPDIMETMDVLGYGRDDSALPDTIMRTFDAISNTSDRDNTLKTLKEMLVYHYGESVSDSPWGRYLVEEFHHFVSEMLKQVRKARALIDQYSWLDKYDHGFTVADEMLQAYFKAKSWDEIHNIFLFFLLWAGSPNVPMKLLRPRPAASGMS